MTRIDSIASKMPYEAPAISTIGTVAELTLGLNGNAGDASGKKFS